jgi:hypothetical protein
MAPGVVQDVVDLPELCFNVARGESRSRDHQQFGESLFVGRVDLDAAVNHGVSRPGTVGLGEFSDLPPGSQEFSQGVKCDFKQVSGRGVRLVHRFPLASDREAAA